MSVRYRQIHNIWALFAGPSPATGYHYSDFNNDKHNNSELSIFDNNLLLPIDRINSFEYGFDINRTNVSHLGQRNLINNYIVNRPEVNVRFNYWMAGVRNENNLGFNVDYTDVYGDAIYGKDICFIKNFTGYETDSRNLFLAINPNDDNINNNIGDQIYDAPINPSSLFVFGFGNCYVNYYGIRAAVGEIPQVSVGYVCDNVMAYNSGSGVNIPAVLPKSGNLVENAKFTIPQSNSIADPSVIRPQDITFQIQDQNYNLLESLYLFNKQTNLYNKIDISGAIGNEMILINNGISNPNVNSYSGVYIKNVNDSSYNLIFSSGADGNQLLIINSGIYNPVGNNIFDSLFVRNVTTTSFVRLNATGLYTNENITINNGGGITGILTEYPVDALFGINSSGIPIQSIEMSINIEREPLKGIGYVLPVNRKIKFPIFANINLSSIVGASYSGNLINLIQKNKGYDILVNMYNPVCGNSENIAYRCKVKNAKLNNTNYNYNLGSNLVGNFSFTAELDVDNLNKGMFISGLLNNSLVEFPFNYIVAETGYEGFLFTEDNNLIIVSDNF